MVSTIGGRLLAGALLVLSAGCAREQKDAVVEPLCPGSTGRLVGRVVDGATSQPLPGALLALEKGGVGLTNPDPTRANPHYAYGAQADDTGRFELELPCGTVGLHAFADGHLCGAGSVQAGEAVWLALDAQPAQSAPPVLSGASLQPSPAAPGSPVTVQVTARAGDPADPLSDAVLAIAPALGVSLALDPPSGGPVQTMGHPDGQWSRTFAAPSAPGTYTYYLVAASGSCVRSASVPLSLSVQ